MTAYPDVESLRRHLHRLEQEFETGLSQRYTLQFRTPEEPGFIRRVRARVGQLLRWLHVKPPVPPPPPPEPWLTELKHVDYGNTPRPFLIWAMDIDRDELRTACVQIRQWQSGSPGWAPVLITNIADFAFFSRLKWLVEYVPSLSAPADEYANRKLRYLAWRYRDVPALPASAAGREGLLEDLLSD
jgi:hypothetical protein